MQNAVSSGPLTAALVGSTTANRRVHCVAVATAGSRTVPWLPSNNQPLEVCARDQVSVGSMRQPALVLVRLMRTHDRSTSFQHPPEVAHELAGSAEAVHLLDSEPESH